MSGTYEPDLYQPDLLEVYGEKMNSQTKYNMNMSGKSHNKLTYLSLFSGAGIGCYGFKTEGYECVATVEILKKRLEIQKFNEKCQYETGYISDDITKPETKNRIFTELSRWGLKREGDLDVLVATPPCQGMSVANHKKGNELVRNSLVVESILLVKSIKPKFFVFENVRAFLNTTCTDVDGCNKKIKDAIESNLAGHYNIYSDVINFKDFGCPSSRTRTVVIGARKDLKDTTPFDFFPERKRQRTLREIIGHLPPLKNMGDIWDKDIYHNFKKYNPEMVDWIKDIKESQSAFDNKDPKKIPHRLVDGKMVCNANKNGDKYTRQSWDKVPPCIHTRNDILASQNTVHPIDNRVFSIREVMLMMSVPESFRWTTIPPTQLNSLQLSAKQNFLAKNEMNIRHSLGEAVPTVIFQQIALKIKNYMCGLDFTEQSISKVIRDNKICDVSSLNRFVAENAGKYSHSVLSKIAEFSNTLRNENAAYYTGQDICYSVVKDLPEAKLFKALRILEPSIGVGNFLPLLVEKYKSVPEVVIDVVDVDENSLKTLKLLLKNFAIPENIRINFIHADFLLHKFSNRYDIVVGNPPFKKITDDLLLMKYRQNIVNTDTRNIFSFFIEKALTLGSSVSFIVPKSLLNAPEFGKTRRLLKQCRFQKINDYGEGGFKGVKIETISFILHTGKRPNGNLVKIESNITNDISYKRQAYIFPKDYPYWLIYRNDYFDEVARDIEFDVFKVFRDRQITKKITRPNGAIRVLKSRNIASNRVVEIKGYDCFVNKVVRLGVWKYFNHPAAVLVPNLTYNPRACFLPKNSIADGSVAILTLKNGSRPITESDLAYYGTEEFNKFYSIARNHGTRSLNIDSNSVFFFGIKKENSRENHSRKNLSFEVVGAGND